MRTRIYNARILTMEDGAEIFRGEIQIEDGKISSVMSCDDNNGTGRKHDVIWDEEIDACGNLIMPGFKNAHTHSPMTFLRTKLAIMEYLTSGITSSFDMYKLKHETARASEETGFRMVLCGDINDFGGTAQDVENDYLKYNKDKDSLISYQMGFHAEYTTSRELMESLAETADRHQAPVCVHCSETKKEVEECRERSGMSPVAYMDSLGLFRHGGVLFHGVHMDDSDFDIIKNHGIYVVTNPASNLKLASGIAPVKRYLELGIPVAIGTDGPASNNCLDMFREMFLVTGLQKVMCDDPEAVPARDVLKMAVTNGAHAMGLTDCDAIAPGKRADLIMIDLSQPNMQPLHNIEKNIVYSASKQNVKMTMIGGRILYQDGEFRIGETKEDIYQNANRIAERILGK